MTLVIGMLSSIRWKGWPLYDGSILKNIWLHFDFNYHQLHMQSINYSLFCLYFVGLGSQSHILFW